MKVRVKFSKEGPMKFIGHLDIMRYFQKAIRRAEIQIAYSEGFSPHMIMSFAAPLGVGITSTGEYFDMEVRAATTSKDMEKRLNQVMVEGMQVLSVRKVEDGKASKAMSLVAAADYQVTFRQEYENLAKDFLDRVDDFLCQKEIVILKKTKKSESEINIKPFIYEMYRQEDSIFCKLATGSVDNTKPELVMDAFAAFLGTDIPPFALAVHRTEVYARTEGGEEKKFVSLDELGEEIE